MIVSIFICEMQRQKKTVKLCFVNIIAVVPCLGTGNSTTSGVM